MPQVDDPLPIPYTPDSTKRAKTFKFGLNDQVMSEMAPANRKPDLSQNSKSMGALMGMNSTPSKAFTRPCKYYAQGFCVKGNACTFLHSNQDSIALTDRLSRDPTCVPARSQEKIVDPSKMF